MVRLEKKTVKLPFMVLFKNGEITTQPPSVSET
jgi:hypothetical protein